MALGPGESFLQQRLLREGGAVLDVGGAGEWTRAALQAQPRLGCHQFDPRALDEVAGPGVTTIDAHCAAAGLRHLNFLKLDAGGRALGILRGARRLLSRRLVDYVQVSYGPGFQEAGARLEQLFDELQRHGYLMFRLKSDGLDHHPGFLARLEDYQAA